MFFFAFLDLEVDAVGSGGGADMLAEDGGSPSSWLIAALSMWTRGHAASSQVGNEGRYTMSGGGRRAMYSQKMGDMQKTDSIFPRHLVPHLT